MISYAESFPSMSSSAKEYQTISNTPCGIHCQMAMVFMVQTSILGSCTCSSIYSWTHGLIQAADPAWGELFHHIGILTEKCPSQRGEQFKVPC